MVRALRTGEPILDRLFHDIEVLLAEAEIFALRDFDLPVASGHPPQIMDRGIDNGCAPPDGTIVRLVVERTVQPARGAKLGDPCIAVALEPLADRSPARYRDAPCPAGEPLRICG